MSYSSGMTSPGLSLTAVSTRTSRFAGRAAVLAATLVLGSSLAACGGGGSNDATSAAPASLQAEQLSLELESAIDKDNTTAFSEQLAARWAELEPKAASEGLTTSSDIDADGGMVSIGGGGVTCVVMVNNEPPLVNRTCQDGEAQS